MCDLARNDLDVFAWPPIGLSRGWPALRRLALSWLFPTDFTPSEEEKFSRTARRSMTDCKQRVRLPEGGLSDSRPADRDGVPKSRDRGLQKLKKHATGNRLQRSARLAEQPGLFVVVQ